MSRKHKKRLNLSDEFLRCSEERLNLVLATLEDVEKSDIRTQLKLWNEVSAIEKILERKRGDRHSTPVWIKYWWLSYAISLLSILCSTIALLRCIL